jgi:hypothetical protein
MCTFVLDDQLVQKAERSLNGLSLQVWLQQQVEALVHRHALDVAETATQMRKVKVRRRAEKAPNDAELAMRFADKPMPPMPEETSWKDIIDANVGKTIKPVEKWL